MKTIIRNFLSVLRRFKMATALNVAGLAVAFAAFIVILIQINFERTFCGNETASNRPMMRKYMIESDRKSVV